MAPETLVRSQTGASRKRRTRRALGVWVAAAMAAGVTSLIVPATSAQASVVYTGKGFDTCSAPSISQMGAWTASPYRSIGIYIGGANRACPDGNLSPAWLNVAESQGWKLAPLYVGLQAPCASQPNLAAIDEANAFTQGSQAADDAVAHAQLLGLATSTPIYLDMEGYNNGPGNNDPGCVPAVLNFVAAWNSELHRRGFLAGVYGSASSTIADQVVAVRQLPSSAIEDDIWFAHWNGQATAFGDPYVPDPAWNQHQRLHQYQGGHVETYNGVSLNIDNNYDDGALGCVGGGASNAAPPGLRTGPAVWSSSSIVAPGTGPGQVAGQVSVVSAGPTRVDAFWRGSDGNLWTTSYADGCGWSTPWSLGSGPLGSDPQAVSSAPGRIDVFWKGGDAGLWHDWNTGNGWAGPESLGGTGTLGSTPSPVSAAPTGITVVWRGLDGNLGTASYSDATGWRGPHGIGGGPLGSDPHPVAYSAGRVAAFWRGQDKNLWEMSADGNSWTGPTFLGAGALGGEPHPASAGAGRIDVFWRGGDRGVWHVWTSDNRTWSGPATQGGGGTVAGDVMAASTAPGRVAVVWRGGDGNLWSAHYRDGVGWTSPGGVGGGPLGSEPAAVSPAPGLLDVYWRGPGGDARHQTAAGV